jgi:angiopoietin 2
MKSVDQKIEILKSSQDRMPLMENQLQSMDFKVQHVFEKVDLLNEKFHDLSKNVLSENQKPSISPKKSPKNFNFEAQEEFEQTEILMRLHSIQRMLTQVQRQNSPNFASKFNKNAEVMKSQRLTNLDQPADLNDVKNLLVKISTGIDKIPIRDIKQSFNLNRKQDKALETITELVNHIDERTTRIFDTNSYQFRKLLTCCKSTEHEITTFTSNADTLLKRVEKVMLKVDDNFELATGDKCPVTGNKTIEKERRSESDGEIHIYTDGESGSASGEDVENNLDEIDDQSGDFNP